MEQHKWMLVALSIFGMCYCGLEIAEALWKAARRALKRRRMRKALRGQK